MLMLIRRVAALSLFTLVLAGCARPASMPSSYPAGTSSAGVSASPGLSASSGVSAAPGLSPAPGASGRPAAPGTISGVVQAGIEPHCLVLRDASGPHVLAFDNASLKSEVTVGAKVTLTGHANPKMMSTCQQGVVFVVTSVSPSS
jgi:hypothetical protein